MIVPSLLHRLCARRRPAASFAQISSSVVLPPHHAERRKGKATAARSFAQRVGQCLAVAAVILSTGVARASQLYAQANRQVSTFGSGVNNAQGTAVDGSGSVYIANADGSVLKETYNSATNTYTQSTLTLSPALTAASGIAVDSSGNLYLSTGANGTVVKYTGSGTAYTAAKTFSGFTGQVSAAVDGSGDVYIAGRPQGAPGTVKLYKSVYASGTYGTLTSIATGFANPNYLAVNAAGTAVYVSDYGTTSIYALTGSGTSYTESTLTISGSTLDHVQGIAVDAAGDLYIQGGSNVFEAVLSGSTYTASVVYAYTGQALALDASGNLYLSASSQTSETKLAVSPNFGSVPVGTAATEIPVTFTFNSAFTLGTPTVLTQGQSPYDFSLDTGTGTTCTSGKAETVNATCTVYVAFTPTAPGTRLGSVNLYDGTTLVATTLISGTGTAPLALFQPGVLNFTYTTGLSTGRGLALDPAGNVYVSQQGAGTVVKFAHNSTTMTTLFTSGNGGVSCSAPSGVAVDGAGNVFFGCENPDKLYELVGGLAGSTPVVIDSNVQVDDNLAVDGAGNLYTSEEGGAGTSGTIYKYAAGTFARTTLYTPASGVSQRFIGMALDANGNLFAVDFIGGQIYELPAGTMGSLTQLTTNSGLSQPHALGVDPAANIYIGLYTSDTLYRFAVGSYSNTPATLTAQSGQAIAIDSKSGTIYSVVGNSSLQSYSRIINPILSFPSTVVGSTSSTATIPNTTTNDNPVVLENDGNAPLLFPVPTSGTDLSVSSNFAFGASTTCPELTPSSTTPGSLAPGASCAAYYIFTPKVAMAITGQASAIDNSLNVTGAAQLATLTGTGTAETPTVTVTPTATPYGNTLTSLSAQVTYGGVQPTGSVTFTVDTGAGVVVADTACTVGSGSEVCTATYNTAALAIGSHTIKAVLGSDGNYATASNTATLTVTQETPLITGNSPSAVAGSNVTLTATITYTGATAPSGAVSFQVAGGASVTATNCTASGGAETCSVSYPTAGVTSGAAITVNVAADTNYAATSVNTGTITVLPSSYTAPTEPAGTTSATQPATLAFSNGGTLGAINVLTQGIAGLDYKFVSGGTCAVGTAYTAGQTCTVLYTFTPATPGPRYGAITLYDNSTSPVLLGTVYLNGIGTGPLVGFAGGAQTTITSNLGGVGAGNIAIDAAGNLYIADFDNNRILKETVSGASYTESSIGTGLNEPNGIAVDGAGNLYIANQAANTIVEEVLQNGTYTQRTIISSGLSQPTAVAVDGVGNLYIANSANKLVLKETPAGGTYTASTVATLTAPSGVAVDGNGVVYIVDQSTNTAYIAKPSGSTYTISTLVTGLNVSYAIDVDGAGNVYIGDTSNNRMLKETLSNGTYTQTTVGTGLTYDQGVVTDAQGNIYIVDSGNNRVIKVDVADAPALAFGSVVSGSTSAAESDTLQNNGNVSLTFSNLAVATSNFALSGSTCSTSTPVVAGGTCTVGAKFTPQTPGALSDTLKITDNNLNVTGAVQPIALTGTATYPVPAITGVAPANGPSAGGTSITITGTGFTGATAVKFGTVAATGFTVNSATSITAVDPAGSPATTVNVSVTTPGGTSAVITADQFAYNPLTAQTITFPQPTTPVVNGAAPVTLTATASSGLPVTFTVTGPATLSGSTLTYTGAGTVTITASQAGNATYAAATPVIDTVTVSAAPTSYLAPTTPVGTTSATQTATLTFTSAGTLNSSGAFVVANGYTNLEFAFVSGGTCVAGATYTAGSACTVEYTFNPNAIGTRLGGIFAENASNQVIASVYLSGVGTGAMAAFTTATPSVLLSGVAVPQFFSADDKGSLYVAGSNNATVYQVYGGSKTAIYTGSGAFVATAVDGLGNVFVSDKANARILKLNQAGSLLSTTTLTGTNAPQPNAIVVGPDGTLYVADPANNGILSISPAGVQSTVSVPGYTFTAYGLAIDTAGALYIPDYANNRIVKLTSAGVASLVTVTGTAILHPNGLSVDAAGDIYVAESGSTLLRISAAGVSSAITPSGLSPAVSYPVGVLADGKGNVFMTDQSSGALYQLNLLTTSTLAFPSVTVGGTGSTLISGVFNAGNTNLTFSAVASNSPNFTLDPAYTTCGVGSAVASGQSCLLGAKFTPRTIGPLQGDLNLTDNTLNATADLQQVPLVGTATGATATVSVSPVSAPYGTATANLSATVTFLAGYAPTGAFTFTLNGTTVTATCTAATSTTETCTYANFPTGTLAGGSYPITGTLAAAGDYTGASDSTHSLTITAVSGATVTVAPSAVVSGGTATLSVTVAGTGLTPTGSVTFTIGSSTTTATCTLAAGACSITYATTGLASGAIITGTYSGDMNYIGAIGTSRLTIIPGSFTAPPEPVGTTSPTQTATLVFNTATTLNSSLATAIQVVTQGVTGLDYAFVSGGPANTACLAGESYTAGQSCTVTYSFSPRAPGLRLGAILLYNNAGTPAVVSTTLLSGLGSGALVDFAGNTPTTLISGVSAPADIKVDAAGNVFYISNVGAGHVYKADSNGNVLTTFAQYYGPVGVAVDGAGDVFTYSSGGCCSDLLTEYVGGGTTSALGFSFDESGQIDGSLAVDGAGNLYLPNAHASNAGYLKLTPKGSGYTESTFLTSQSVRSVTVDAAGNVYAATTANTLYMVTPSGTTTQIPVAGMSNISGMAADAAGNLYLAAQGNNAVYRLAAGTYTQTTVASGFAPYGIALDGSGNLYIGDATNSRILKLTRSTAPALNFPSTAVGASSAAMYDTLENDGNLPLNFSALVTSVADFTVDTPSTTCSTGTPLAAGVSCNLGARFTPRSVNPSLQGTFNLTDDALNTPGTTQQVMLTGPSTFGTATVSMPGVGVPTGGIASLSVTVTGGGITPTGSVNFTIGATTVSCTLVGGTCSAPFNAAGLPAGPVTVTLAYLGDPNYSPQPGSGTLTVGVGTAVVVVPNIAAVPGGSAALTASITGNGQPPAGTISFIVGTGAAVQATCSTAGAVETCTAPYLTTGLTGTAQITASFGNDPNYAATTGTGTLTLVPGSSSAGSLPVGTPSGTQTATVVFTTGGTLSGINVLTQGATGLDYAFVAGGTCATGTAYTAGTSCTVEYTFTPLAPGARLGGITLTDSTGAVLGGSFLTGTATGPLAVLYPGTQTAVITGLGDAFELAADASNNLYVGDFKDSLVYKETLSGGVYTQAILGSGFANPGGIAVDGQGNVFIADQGKGRIVEEVLNTASGAYTQTVPFTNSNSGLGNPFAVAVDSTGTVYLGDGGRLLKEVPAGSGYTQTVLDTGFGNLTSLAVDSTGDLFLADSSGSVYEETLSNGAYTRSTIATGLNNSNGVFVDASGTLYVTASGSSVLRFVPNGTGGYTQGATVGKSFGRPNGLTLDSLGNVYVADDPNGGTVYKIDLADSPTFNFGATTPVGGTGAAQTSTLTNIGNQPLNLSTLTLSDSTDFSLGGSTCTATGTVGSAASCGINVAFTPQSVGTLTGTATSTDNSLNQVGAAQTIHLNATSVQATPGISVLNESLAYGTATEKLSATVTFTAGLVPTGTFTFTVGAGQPLTASCVPGTATTEICTASLTTSALPAGVYPVVATLAADANYATLSGTGSLTLTQTTPTLTVSPASILYGTTPTTLSVQVAYAGTAVPTGGVTVQVDGGSTLPATCSGTGSPLLCTVSYPTGTLTAGAHTVTATLAADTDYATATGTGSLAVSATGAAVTVASAQVNAGTPTTTLRATIAFSGAIPGGAFTFSIDNAAAIPATCTAVTANSESCIVAYTTSQLSVGTHTIKGVLGADSNYTATSGQATLTVISVTPVVTVAAPTFAYGAANTTFTATVAYAASAVPTGTFTFRVDSGAVINATCTGSSSPLTCTGSYPTAAITAGTHTLTGTSGADTTYVSSFGTAVFTVGKTTPTLSVAGPSVSYGTHTVTLSTTVAFSGAAPTGAVTFTVDGGAALAATCTGGASPETCTASYTSAALGTGAHTVSATVAADTNYNSTTASSTLTVTSAAPTLTVASPSVLYGAATANLSASLTFTGTAPTGNVTFQVDNGAVVKATCTGSASPLTCTAAYTTSALTTGSHTVTASVAGDANYSANSATGTLTVNASAPTLTVANPSAIYGATSVNLSATVAFPGAVPTGSLTFSVDNGTPVTAVCSGTASPRTCNVSYPLGSLAAGNHTVTASLAADSNYSAVSGKGTLMLTSTAPTVLVASASVPYGTTSTTLSATVAFAGTALPTGALTFTVDNGTAVAATCTGTGSPVTCTASYATATLAAGAHSVTASFAGDANYSPATGGGTLTVTAVSPTLTFTVPNHTFGDAPFTVAASSTGTGAFTYTVVSGPATVSGSTVTLTGAGTVVLQATQAAGTDYSGGSKQATFTVAQASAAISVTASATQVNPLQSVTLTATVSSSTGATPGGSVTFFDNGVAIGTVPLVNGVASLPTTTLAAGTVNVISVSYSGDGNFLPSTSGAGVTVTVGPLDFTFLLSGDHGFTAVPGTAASYNFALSPVYGTYAGTVSFSVTGLPSGATATFSPSSVPVSGGPQPIVMSVLVPQSTASNSPHGPFERTLPLLALLLLPTLGSRRVRRSLGARALTLLLLVVGLGGAALLTGCGTTKGNGFELQEPHTYTLTVTATSGTLEHSQTVTLTVQ